MQSVRADLGRGLANFKLGSRLRYVAPYIGVSWDRKVG
ncbi:copper resistance protein B [Bradyrhizobium sp.]|nr:copper resistance protein B [Bradyrhizobium sp.]